MINRLAYFFSVFFHPLLLPTFLFGTIFYYLPEVAGSASASLRLYLLLAVFITTFVIPLISMLLLRMTSNISDLELVNRSERVMPFFFITLFYTVTTYLFIEKMQVGFTFAIILSGITLLIFLISVITLFIKVSAHAASVCASTGFLIVLQYLYHPEGLLTAILVSIVVSGIVISSRLHLQVHDTKETLAGILLGLAVSLSSLFML